MKREFWKAIEGLTEEAIDKIMAEHGKDMMDAFVWEWQTAESKPTGGVLWWGFPRKKPYQYGRFRVDTACSLK